MLTEYIQQERCTLSTDALQTRDFAQDNINMRKCLHISILQTVITIIIEAGRPMSHNYMYTACEHTVHIYIALL